MCNLQGNMETGEVLPSLRCMNNDSKPKLQSSQEHQMTSSTTSINSSLSSPVDSGVQLLDSESEITSVMSTSGMGCDLDPFQFSDIQQHISHKSINHRCTSGVIPTHSPDNTINELIDTHQLSKYQKCKLIDDLNVLQYDLCKRLSVTGGSSEGSPPRKLSSKSVDNLWLVENKSNDSDLETNEIKCQLDLYEKERGLARIKDISSQKINAQLNVYKENNHMMMTISDIDNQNIAQNITSSNRTSTPNRIHMNLSCSTPCFSNSSTDYSSFLVKSYSDDVFEMEHPIQNNGTMKTAEPDIMNISLNSYELLDYTSENKAIPIVNDQMHVSMSEEVNENLRINLACENVKIPENVPIIEPEFKPVEDQIVFRRQRKKKSKSDTPKKRVSFHEDILNSTKIDDIHINHGFVTHEPDVSLSFFQRGFVRKADVVKGRYSWAAEGDVPYYEKPVPERKINSDLYMPNARYSSTSSSSTGSISSSIDEEDNSDENQIRREPNNHKLPKSSCLKKTNQNKKIIDTKIVQEENNSIKKKPEANLLDSHIFGSLKNILNFSTSVPLAERGVPEGQEDVPICSSSHEVSHRRRSCTNFSFMGYETVPVEPEPVRKIGNLNLELAKTNLKLTKSEGFYPNYPSEQKLPTNIILCDSNVYEHKGISYSYEYDNFQKTFEQQNKQKSSTIYQMILKEFNFFRKKAKEPQKEVNEEFEVISSPLPSKSEISHSDGNERKNSLTGLNKYASSTKLDWSDNETVSDLSESLGSRHLHSPKKRINKSNHYTVQSSFRNSSDIESCTFFPKNFNSTRSSSTKSSLINRFLRNVTLKKMLDGKAIKKDRRNKKSIGLTVKTDKKKFSGYDEIDRELEIEIMKGLKNKVSPESNSDSTLVSKFKREVFRSNSELLLRVFTVRSAYMTNGDSKPLFVILTNNTLYISSLKENDLYCNHFVLPYSELNTILVGPKAQTIHIANYDKDMQCVISTGCAFLTSEVIGQLEIAMRRDTNKPTLPAVKHLTMRDMTNLRKAICKQTSVNKDEDYVYYSIVNIQDSNPDTDSTPLGPNKEGPLMFKTQDLDSRWETAYFILKGGVMYMLSSASHRLPMRVFPLINGSCQGAKRVTISQRPHTFQIVIEGKSLYLAAPDEYVASEWLQALIHAASRFYNNREKAITQSCSLLMTSDHILTVREAFPCTIKSLLPTKDLHQPLKGPQALSCASIIDLTSFRLPSAEQSWCILEFACREVHECSGDWILYFSSNSELENFISTLESLWDYNNEQGDSFPLSTIPETDPISKRCMDVYMSLKNSWSSNTVLLQFL